jgi:glycosyltransferase involved in cell wall biosynthesis
MTKILAFLNAYTHGKSGGDVCFVEIYKRMPKFHLTVVTSKLGQKFCEENGLQAAYKITTKEKRFQNVLSTYIRRIWGSFRIDAKISEMDAIYSTSDALPDTLSAWYFSVRYRKKWIATVFHIVSSDRFISYVSQKISHFLIKHANIVIIDNLLLRKELQKRGFDKKKIILRYPGITVPQKIDAIGKNYDAITVSRLHESKGIEDLITIWKQVVQTMPDKKLGIIGTGDHDYQRYLLTLIRQKKLEKSITFLGYLDEKKVFEHIKSADIFLFPSHEEGFGMAVGEALAIGTPVIAYDLPAYEHTFKKNMTTIPCFDKQRFAEKTIQQLHKKNPQEKNDIVKRFTWENAVHIEQTLYE